MFFFSYLFHFIPFQYRCICNTYSYLPQSLQAKRHLMFMLSCYRVVLLIFSIWFLWHRKTTHGNIIQGKGGKGFIEKIRKRRRNNLNIQNYNKCKYKYFKRKTKKKKTKKMDYCFSFNTKKIKHVLEIFASYSKIVADKKDLK